MQNPFHRLYNLKFLVQLSVARLYRYSVLNTNLLELKLHSFGSYFCIHQPIFTLSEHRKLPVSVLPVYLLELQV